MSFQTTLRESIAQAITDYLRLSGNLVRFYPLPVDVGEAMWWRQFLKALFENDVFKPEHFRSAVIAGVTTCGLEMHKQVMRGGVYPDHVVSPEALAYVLKSGAVTSDQANRIRFDHGETLAQFEARPDRLIDNILFQLANL